MTTGADNETLRRIRAALASGSGPSARPPHPGSFTGYPDQPPPGDDALVERFGRQIEALSGRMYRASGPAEAANLVLGIASSARAQRVLSWDEAWLDCPGLHAALEGAGIQVTLLDLPDDPPAREALLADVAEITVGVTGAQAAIADTGTIVLASGIGRSRMASLLPPVHVALVRRCRLYPTLPSFLAAHAGLVAEASTVALITGPSRTADIEMTLTHGVHGPREVHVIVMP